MLIFQVNPNKLLKWTLPAFLISFWFQENLITYVAQIFDSLYIHCAYLEGPPDQEICILIICINFFLTYIMCQELGKEVDLMVSKAT